MLCVVSNGSTINVDGGVSGGSESCASLCSLSQYELDCAGDAQPDPTLGCTVIPLPTPAGYTDNCCPCAE
jgi:hypothetical protein